MLKKILELLLSHLSLPKAFIDVLEPVLEKAGDSLLADATVAAQPIVASLQNAKLPSADKRAQAVSQLEAVFAKDGKALLANVANLAVELAVAKLKA